MKLMVFMLGLLVFVGGCSTTNKNERQWDFRFGWDKGVTTPGEPSKDNPQYDNDGNLIVPPEVVNTYKFPDVHAGYCWVPKTNEFKPILSIEPFEFKTPYLRWNGVDIIGGENLVGVGVSHVWTSIFEIKTGVLFGRDLIENTWVVGVDLLIIKF